jgi:hypothetical protein
MKGFFKAKKSYEKAKKSYKSVSFRKHKQLLDGEAVFIESKPRLIGDLTKHLIECDSNGKTKKSEKSENEDK